MYAKNHNNSIIQIDKAIEQYTNVIKSFNTIQNQNKSDKDKQASDKLKNYINIVEKAFLSRADCYKLLKKYEEAIKDCKCIL